MVFAKLDCDVIVDERNGKQRQDNKFRKIN